jgi:hypothetical protein
MPKTYIFPLSLFKQSLAWKREGYSRPLSTHVKYSEGKRQSPAIVARDVKNVHCGHYPLVHAVSVVGSGRILNVCIGAYVNDHMQTVWPG